MTSDAATSTDDIEKGRPLCLYYFAHPFGVLSVEPPMVLAPGVAAPATVPTPTGSAMTRRHAAAWPPPPGASVRRLPPYTRNLPPLRLPTPRDSSLDSSDDIWSLPLPAEKMALPPLEAVPLASPRRACRSPRLGGVRKGAVRARTLGSTAGVARLLRQAVATVECRVLGPSCVRAAWQSSPGSSPVNARPDSSASDQKRTSSGSETRSVIDVATSKLDLAVSSAGVGSSAWDDASGADDVESIAFIASRGSGVGSGAGSAGAGASDMRALSPGLLHRRYSVPETVMRRYRLARELSDTDDEYPAVSAHACSSRDLYRRSALLRRLGAAGATPCRCQARSLAGSRGDVRPPRPPRLPPPPPALRPPDPFPPTPDFLEVVVTETTPTDLPRPTTDAPIYPPTSNMDIDEYVSNILVDSLNSLTDKLENMTVSIGGDSQISVVEKKIKVKLRSKGVNTVVHLSPTSNNQIIFGNKELCERDVPASPGAQKMTCREPEDTGASWCEERAASPCASLVDSLDDPQSPRAPPPPPQQPPPPPPQAYQPPPPPQDNPPREEQLSTPRDADSQTDVKKEKSKSFFIRMNEDNCACEKENIVVADHMPEKIKQRLYRRQRRRELRAQGARRGVAPRRSRDLPRQCAALVDALIDDAVARIAREEYRYARIARRQSPAVPKDKCLRSRPLNVSSKAEQPRPRAEVKPQPSPPPLQLPPPASLDRGSQRLYHKSEIHDGGKCIEILEIVEYAQTSRSSSETNSDGNGTKTRKSRIPVPIQEKHETVRPRRIVVLPQAADTSCQASMSTDGSLSRGVPELLRFERVFDVIPEERSSLSVESASDEATRAPGKAEVAPAAAPAPRAAAARRSAATSPLAPSGSGGLAAEDVSMNRTTLDQKDVKKPVQRSVGTQWVTTPAQTRAALVRVRPGAAEAGARSSSETEAGSPPPPARPARRRPRPRPRSRQQSDGGWSLTLAGSCHAALPTRLDLRLRFPGGGGDAAATHTPRSDAPTDCCSDARSQETEWGAPGGGGAAARPRSPRQARASRDTLPSLHSSTRSHSHSQARRSNRRSLGTGSAAGLGACRGPLRHGNSPFRASGGVGGEMKACGAPPPVRGARALAVLGAAIVPERRAAAPTASQRHIGRRIRARCGCT